jgi:hypothetical protein
MRQRRARRGDRSSPSRAAILGFVLLLGLAGWSLSSPARAAPPTVTILSPAMDAVIGNGSPVVVIFMVSDFNLTKPGTGGPPDPNEGHVVVSVDGLRTTAVSALSVDLDLPSGPHDIELQLVTDDGTPLSPDVRDSIRITITQGPAVGVPRISIMNPTQGSVRSTDLVVSFRLTNFTLVPPGGAAGVSNEGHIHVTIDGALYQELTDYEPVHLGLEGGPHTIRLQLVDSEHRPLTPDVSASVTFTVNPGVGRVTDFGPALAIANGLLGLGILGLLLVRRWRMKR